MAKGVGARLSEYVGRALGAGQSEQVRQRRIVMWAVVGLLVLAVVPFVAGNYWTRVVTGIIMFVTLCEAWNLLTGYTGYFGVGTIVFFGTGAYVTAVLVVKLSVPLPLAILAGGIFSAAYAVLLGLPILRLSGMYFAIATIGINLATREIVLNIPQWTGGGAGITLPMMRVPLAVFYRYIYFGMLALMVLCILSVYYIIRSRTGFALRAIGADEHAARSMGINTTKYKVFAWAFSAFFFGLVGGLYAYWFTFVEPIVVFNPNDGLKIVAMVYLGGARTIPGPFLGAFILELIMELVWGQFLELHLAVLGLIILFVTIVMPDGLMSLIGGEMTLRGLFKSVKDRRL
jgi:branched-chain amino acid transport system permease protein